MQTEREALRKALLSGELKNVAEDAVLALEEMLNEELQKPAEAMDTDFIEKGENLLWAIRTGDKLPNGGDGGFVRVAHEAKRREGVKIERRRIVRRLTLRAALCVPVFFLLLFFLDVQQPITPGIRLTYTEYAQQVMVESAYTLPALLPRVEAADGQEMELKEYRVDTPEKLEAAIGYRPPLLYPEDPSWEDQQYIAHRFPRRNRLSLNQSFQRVRNDQTEYLIFQYDKTDSFENMFMGFEQSEAGRTMITPNGLSVYVSHNMGQYFALWSEETAVLYVTAPVNVDTLLTYVDMVR